MSDEQKQSEKKVTVVLTGNSHGGKPGDKRETDAATARNLVRNGLARYPASK